MQVIAQFSVSYYQFLTEQNQLTQDAPIFAKDAEQLISLYRVMVLSRIFDNKAIALQRTGKMGTYPSTRGQEAVFAGIGSAMLVSDVYVPYYRDVAALIQRGVKLSNILLYWGGDERGNEFADAAKNFSYAVPIATQTLHAAGIATAMRIKNEDHCVVCVSGDGATSEGDFYEAMNVAGVWKLPIVFIVNNNQWAISVPRTAQSAAETLAQKAIAAGFSGEQVDGNDVIAVKDRVEKALHKARTEKTPTLIEMLCYRHCDHTTADDASRYEAKELRSTEWIKEPIERLKRYLESIKAWNQTKETALQESCIQEVDSAVAEYLAVSVPRLESMFDHLYASLPQHYQAEYEELKARGGKS